jgi:transcriptional regulator with XRE-family HTH domain
MTTGHFAGLLPQKKAGRGRAAGQVVVKPTRAESNANLRKVVGERFVDARRLNGWDQTEAAERFGYTNSTQLSLIEQGKRLPPHEVMIKASEVYGVSLDFLYGLSDEPERDPKAAERQAAMRHVHSIIEGTGAQIISRLMLYLAQGVPSVRTSEAMLDALQVLVDEVHRTRELNPKLFDEKMKNGSKLVRAAVTAAEACSQARDMLARHERVTEFKMSRAEQRAGVTHPLLDAMTPGEARQ